MDINTLVGQEIVKIEVLNHTELIIHTTDDVYKMHHEQDCCEKVYLEDICGDLDDMLGVVVNAYSSSNLVKDQTQSCDKEQQQWTFYHISTIKGTVTLRWYGASNGYYATEVSFEKVEG